MDRRQRKTRNAIFTAFSSLLEKKKYSTITVQDIIDEADVARSTFYGHFETKDELLKSMCEDIFLHVFSEELTSEENHDFSHNRSFEDRITHILYHLKEKQQRINGLFRGECGELFTRYLKEYMHSVFEDRIKPGDSLPQAYVLDVAVSAFAETVVWWLRCSIRYTPEQITSFYLSCIKI